LTNFLKKKLEGTPEDKARKQQLKQETKEARWEGKRKGSIERARREGYHEGRGTSKRGLSFADPLGGLGGTSGVFANPFVSTAPRKHSTRHSGKGKGTTIKVDGATITIHNRQKSRQHHRKRRRESDFPF